MSFTHADYLAMQARCDGARKNIVRNLGDPAQKETGKRGIQSDIEEWLKTQSHRAWWDVKRTDQRTTSRIGVPDFIGVFAGVPFGLEVKAHGKKPTTEQLGELAWMRKAGAKTKVVYSKDEAVEFFLGLVKENAAVGIPQTTAAHPSNEEKESR